MASLFQAVRQQNQLVDILHHMPSARNSRMFSAVCFRKRVVRPQCLLQIPHRPSSPSRSLPSSHQSRSFLAKLVRAFPASSQSPSPSSENAEEVQSPNPPLQLTNLPYFVRRTPSNQLPVYLVTKTGGTKQQTKIQKTEGDLEALRNDLARTLGLESGDPRAAKSPEVAINRLNGHIIVKGWRKPEIQKFLLERNF